MDGKQLLAGQIAFIEKTRKAAQRCSEMAEEASRLNLQVLAREWNYFGDEMKKKIDLQIRAFRDEALSSKGER